jgi:hypothetical protein
MTRKGGRAFGIHAVRRRNGTASGWLDRARGSAGDRCDHWNRFIIGAEASVMRESLTPTTAIEKTFPKP